jgi:hypothetical protein
MSGAFSSVVVILNVTAGGVKDPQYLLLQDQRKALLNQNLSVANS